MDELWITDHTARFKFPSHTHSLSYLVWKQAAANGNTCGQRSKGEADRTGSAWAFCFNRAKVRCDAVLTRVAMDTCKRSVGKAGAGRFRGQEGAGWLDTGGEVAVSRKQYHPWLAGCLVTYVIWFCFDPPATAHLSQRRWPVAGDRTHLSSYLIDLLHLSIYQKGIQLLFNSKFLKQLPI